MRGRTLDRVSWKGVAMEGSSSWSEGIMGIGVRHIGSRREGRPSGLFSAMVSAVPGLFRAT
ncbi:hypothetical protein BKA80DRAFT_282573 [Phyllosticta citrichinensis]